MLDYEWGNPSNMMLTPNEDGSSSSSAAAASSDQAHGQIFDQYASHNFLPDYFLHGPGPTSTTYTTTTTNTDFTHHQHFNPQVHHTFFDPRAYHGASSTSYPPPQPPPPSMLSLDPMPHVNSGPGPGFLMVPKSDDMGRPMDFVGSRLGLNLGGRTYFSSSEDDFVSRLYHRSRPGEPRSSASSNSPRCQAEGCNADLSHGKHYHRRHKVCEFHSKASTVIAAGLTQRFCQQCSRMVGGYEGWDWKDERALGMSIDNDWGDRTCGNPEGICVLPFHLLSEFDNGKRSCRKRLADHNRRRRKTQQPTQEIHKSQLSLDNVARSPSDSGAQSSSSVTVAVSPPDYFRQRPPYQSSSPSTNSSSLFFSSG